MWRSAVCILVLILAPTAATAAAGQVNLQDSVFQQAARLPIGERLDLVEFPAGPGILAAMSFRRIDVYAPQARIFVVDASGQHEVPRSRRVHLVGYSKDGNSRVGLSFDPDLGSAPYAAGSGPSGAFVLRSERVAGGWRMHAISAEAALPAGVTLEFPSNVDALPDPNAAPEVLNHLIGVDAPSGMLRSAVVAVDTDTTFMSKRFGGNPGQATAWVADLFAQMNVMYQRDLDVKLQQGTTFLRTASDPYANTDNVASSAMLAEFGSYWQANYSSGGNRINRAFAMLLSGNSSSGNSASGIAWLDGYCEFQSTGGGYSTNQIFWNSAVGVASSAFIVGHELGHNFGAAHTHCTNATTGGQPTGTNTIDKCFRAESGCYSGAVSCPASGPGAPLGSVMSYCHTSMPNGASCGSNVQQFHPIHIVSLLGRIAANTPSCLGLGIDLIFDNGFE